MPTPAEVLGPLDHDASGSRNFMSAINSLDPLEIHEMLRNDALKNAIINQLTSTYDLVTFANNTKPEQLKAFMMAMGASLRAIIKTPGDFYNTTFLPSY